MARAGAAAKVAFAEEARVEGAAAALAVVAEEGAFVDALTISLKEILNCAPGC